MVRLRTVVTVLLVISIAGCNQPDAGASPTDQSNLETQTTDDPVTDGVQTSHTNTESERPTIEPRERLTIHSDTNESLSITLYQYTDSGPPPNSTDIEPANWRLVDSVTYDDPRGTFSVTEFEPNGQILIKMNERVIWERQVEPFERYELRISETGEVEVTDYWVL